MNKPQTLTAFQLSEAAGKIVEILEKHEIVERKKIFTAVLTLLGEELPVLASKPINPQEPAIPMTPAHPKSGSDPAWTDAKTFFDVKDPNNKIEELVLAARYAEIQFKQEENSKEELGKIVSSARRNFDKANFARDIDNARTKGLFTRVGKHDSFTLAYYGQQYADALPDREKVKSLKKPKKAAKAARKKKKNKKPIG